MSVDAAPVDRERPAAPEPEFAVLGVAARPYAAVPALDFDVHITEPTGRQVYVVALTAQIMIEPARREYDDEERARLVELFGPPERWGATTNSLVWHRADALVPSFTGAITFHIAVPISFDLEVAGAKYFNGVGGGEVPLAFNFNGTIHYRDDDDRLKLSLVPWSCSAEYRFPIDVWRRAIDACYPGRRWIAVHEETLSALLADKARRGLATLDAEVAALLEEGAR